MVRLFEDDAAKKVAKLIYAIFHFQERFTHIVRVDFPDVTPCIYAMWHRNQMCIYGNPDFGKINVMVSRSKDGEMIANVIEHMGFKTIRGSKGKEGAVEASVQLIDALKKGENGAMMEMVQRDHRKKQRTELSNLLKWQVYRLYPFLGIQTVLIL